MVIVKSKRISFYFTEYWEGSNSLAVALLHEVDTWVIKSVLRTLGNIIESLLVDVGRGLLYLLTQVFLVRV